MSGPSDNGAAPPSHQLVTEANRAFYAATAKEYDNLGKGATVQLAQDNAASILERVPGIKDGQTELLDFAAGTGLLSMLLAPRVKSIYAVDLSEDMVGVLQSKLDAQPADARVDNIHPIAADLLASTPPQLEGKQVDVVTCTMAFHHFADPARVASVLSGFLRSGGYLAIVDLIHQDEPIKLDEPAEHGQAEGHEHGHGHDHGHGHGHDQQAGANKDNVIAHKHGFSRQDMLGFFEAAGLKLVEMEKSSQFNWRGRMFDTFLAVAQKP
ncbi:uncharacterized protein PFL1_03651 [Pseudozyma flocculosa PF-1]|uniref:Methyltransferase domain-containing protein n=2 Tax=Pseudozyma flocculosa TaxID=84751 RepID=A0A5C3F5H2_9BASI|nr:uncharacterized protein PFL1_03651 [Pseudozyma flocculosa PF-1]EPQ28848.1 hypothetical protein PFL1_03651 [Pseudozyma flocculosa PF-1]SPO39360.1 uncharacterized protein PSFLO_04841 [Pseudozyma flocculosa]